MAPRKKPLPPEDDGEDTEVLDRKTRKVLTRLVKMPGTEAAKADVKFNLALYARSSVVFDNKEDFVPVSPDMYQQQIDRLNDTGYLRVGEAVASGVLPWEWARRNGYSQMVFRDWWDKAPAAFRSRAYRAHAEACVVKAELVLSVAPLSKEDAQVQTALAGAYMNRAEKLDPEQWNPGKSKPVDSRALSIKITGKINGMSHLYGGGPVIDADAPLKVAATL